MPKTELDEDSLDRHYAKQLHVLSEISAMHADRTDLTICKTWLKIFKKAPSDQKYARNCLMFLLFSQLKERGQLTKPFTDMRNCTKHLEIVFNEHNPSLAEDGIEVLHFKMDKTKNNASNYTSDSRQSEDSEETRFLSDAKLAHWNEVFKKTRSYPDELQQKYANTEYLHQYQAEYSETRNYAKESPEKYLQKKNVAHAESKYVAADARHVKFNEGIHEEARRQKMNDVPQAEIPIDTKYKNFKKDLQLIKRCTNEKHAKKSVEDEELPKTKEMPVPHFKQNCQQKRQIQKKDTQDSVLKDDIKMIFKRASVLRLNSSEISYDDYDSHGKMRQMLKEAIQRADNLPLPKLTQSVCDCLDSGKLNSGFESSPIQEIQIQTETIQHLRPKFKIRAMRPPPPRISTTTRTTANETKTSSFTKKKSIYSVSKTISCDNCCRKDACPCLGSSISGVDAYSQQMEEISKMDDLSFLTATITTKTTTMNETTKSTTLNSNCSGICTKETPCETCTLRVTNALLENELKSIRIQLDTQKEISKSIAEKEEIRRKDVVKVTTAVVPCEKRKIRLRRQIFNGTRLALRYLEDERYAQNCNILVTMYACLSSDNVRDGADDDDDVVADDDFKMQLLEFDRRFDCLLQEIFKYSIEQRKEEIIKTFKELTRTKCEKKRLKMEQQLQMRVVAEEQQQKLSKLTYITMLKKLFIELFLGKMEHTKIVVNSLDEEYLKLSKQLHSN